MTEPREEAEIGVVWGGRKNYGGWMKEEDEEDEEERLMQAPGNIIDLQAATDRLTHSPNSRFKIEICLLVADVVKWLTATSCYNI